jgi:uncharacterized membrane protein
MEGKARVLGHSAHPMLIVFPLGLLATAAIFDIIYMITGTSMWALVSFYLIAAGIIGGLLAAVPGFIDYLAIPNSTRAKAVAAIHGIGNVLVLALFAVSWLLRRDQPVSPGALAIAASLTGACISLVTGWLGGELVERLGVGVYNGAHVDAPNSLSGRSTHEQTTNTNVI